MKNVLIITYYWPPAGGPGVQRWLKFVKYLPEYAIHPIVYIPKNPNYPLLDFDLKKEISPKATIIEKTIVEPYVLASFFSKKNTKTISAGMIPKTKNQTLLQKVLLWIRGNVFIPDARVLWVKPSVHFLEEYIVNNNIATIITTGPPHSLHLIGLRLKKKLNIHWIADFRDPWTTIGYHAALKLSAFAQKKHLRLEKEVLHLADTIIVTSKTTKKSFESLTSKPIEVITNGYDVENIEKQALDSTFSLAHIGSLLSDRNPLILWESLSELIQENPLFASHFQLKLIGKTSQEVLDTIHQFGLEKFVSNLGYIPHQEAIKEQRKSQVLLLLEIDSYDTKSIIPGKLFEYMVSERPILAIGPMNSDFSEIILNTNTGKFFTYSEKEALKYQIISYFNLFLNKELKVFPVGLQEYSRMNLTAKLAKLIR